MSFLRMGSRAIALSGLTALILMAFGAQVGLAADYQDAKHNVCEGTFTAAGCSEWGKHVSGIENVALGDAMMPQLTSGEKNVALDFRALEHDTTGIENVAIGPSALRENTEGIRNIASGFEALSLNTIGSDNIATGTAALFRNTTGYDNIATGTGAMESNTEGHFNLASGREALGSNKSGTANIALGVRALNANTIGVDNVATGVNALIANTEGTNNTANGTDALIANTTGNENVASGLFALEKNTTGSSNVALGSGAGKSLTTGSNNIEIANAGVAAESGTTRIGTEGKQTKAFLAGVNKAPLTGKLLAVKVNESGQLGTAKASSGRLKRDVRPLGASAAKVLSLSPVSFRYKPQFAQGANQLEYGLIAEQVARLFPSLVQYEANGKPGGVYYEELPVLLLAQLQREHARANRQQHQIDQLASELKSLRAEIHAHR